MRIARELKTSVAPRTEVHTSLAAAMRALASATNATDVRKAANLRRSRTLAVSRA